MNSTLIEAEPRRTDIEVAGIPCTRLARAGGDDRLVSIVALGGLLARRPIVGRESLRLALIEVLGAKRPEMIDANLEAVATGYRAATEAAAARPALPATRRAKGPISCPRRERSRASERQTAATTGSGTIGISSSVRYSLEARTSPGPLRYRSRTGPTTSHPFAAIQADRAAWASPSCSYGPT